MTQLLLPDIKGYSTEDLMEELRRRGIDVNLIEHHDKYLEIDGVDETRLVTHNQHREIHKQWRKKGRIIPRWVARKAEDRTKRHHESCKKYNKKNMYRFNFTETVMSNVQMAEELFYNKSTGKIFMHSRFFAINGRNIYYLTE